MPTPPPDYFVRDHKQPADTAEYFGKDGRQLGAIVSVRHHGQNHYFVFAHDWGNGPGYDPIPIMTTQDYGEGAREILDRWREHIRATNRARVKLAGW